MVNSTKNLGGAPLGNNNSGKGRLWARAINKALKNRSKTDAFAELVDLAEQLLMKCTAGDLTALKELGDRIDGKPAQAVTLGGDPENPLILQPVMPRPSKEESQKMLEDFKANKLQLIK